MNWGIEGGGLNIFWGAEMSTKQGTEMCNFGAPSPLDFFFGVFPSGFFFCFSPSLLCNLNLGRKWAQNVEKIARSPGGEKKA